MPLPMIHLAVAREYAKASANFAGLINCPEYYLGSISPDAVHMRPGTGKSDKGITHLLPGICGEPILSILYGSTRLEPTMLSCWLRNHI